MKKSFYFLLLVTCVISLSSCGGGSRKAMQLAKEYLGKTVSGAKKSHLERYADDVARVKFTKVRCTSCAGTGYVGYSTCEICEGDGWVYKVEKRY